LSVESVTIGLGKALVLFFFLPGLLLGLGVALLFRWFVSL